MRTNKTTKATHEAWGIHKLYQSKAKKAKNCSLRNSSQTICSWLQGSTPCTLCPPAAIPTIIATRSTEKRQGTRKTIYYHYLLEQQKPIGRQASYSHILQYAKQRMNVCTILGCSADGGNHSTPVPYTAASTGQPIARNLCKTRECRIADDGAQ